VVAAGALAGVDSVVAGAAVVVAGALGDEDPSGVGAADPDGAVDDDVMAAAARLASPRPGATN
jgi:hypothetical protein